MTEAGSHLRDLFLEHHRLLIHGLKHLQELVQKGEIQLAAEEADKLDQLAGPHLEFEEIILYPELTQRLGSEFVKQLYGEHREGQLALRTLQRYKSGLPPDELTTRQVNHQLQTALDHVSSCGSLLSHVNGMEPERQEQMLRRLQEINQEKYRWTQLPLRNG